MPNKNKYRYRTGGILQIPTKENSTLKKIARDLGRKALGRRSGRRQGLSSPPKLEYMIRGSVAERGPSLPSLSQRLQEAPLSRRQQDILDMVVNRPRTGRTWDNRLGGGERRAREQAEARRSLPRGRASGGIIGLRGGGGPFGGMSGAMGGGGGWGGGQQKPMGGGMQQPMGGGGGWGGGQQKPGLQKPMGGSTGFGGPMPGGMGGPGGGWQGGQEQPMYDTSTAGGPRGGGGGWGGQQKPMGGGGAPPWQQGGFDPTKMGGVTQAPYSDPRFGPGTPASAAGSGSRSDPFLNDPQGLAQFQAQQGGQQGQALGPWVGPGGPGGQPGQAAYMVQPPPGGGPGGGPQPQPPAYQGYQPQALPEGYGGPSSFQGYGGPRQMDVTQSFVSPEVASQYSDLTTSIMNIGTRPYEQYQGPQLASFTPAEAAAQAAYTAVGTGQGPQGTLQAESTLDEAAQATANLAPQQQRVGEKFSAYAPLAQEQAQTSAEEMRVTGETAGDPTMQTDKDAGLDKYQSQFVQGAIDPKIRAIREEAARQRSELGSKAAQAGAFGSYRHGLGEQAAGQAATQQIADVTGEGYQKAFESAQQAFQSDRAAKQAGLTQQQQAQQAAGQMEQTGFGTMGDLFSGEQAAYTAQGGTAAQMANIGRGQMDLGQQQQQQLSQRLGEMQRAGASQRELQQAAMDIRRQQWEQQRQHPERQAQWTSQMLASLPYQNIQQTASYAPQGSAAANIIGGGITGYGLWNQFQANRPGGGTPTPGTTNTAGGAGSSGATAGNQAEGEFVGADGRTMYRDRYGNVTEVG